MNEAIQKALKHLEQANISGYFDEMDKVEMPNLQMKSTYAQFKGVFMAGQAPWDFAQKLETFAKDIKKNITEPENPPSEEKSQEKTTTIIINNQGATIGQQNNNSTVDNKGANFNF